MGRKGTTKMIKDNIDPYSQPTPTHEFILRLLKKKPMTIKEIRVALKYHNIKYKRQSIHKMIRTIRQSRKMLKGGTIETDRSHKTYKYYFKGKSYARVTGHLGSLFSSHASIKVLQTTLSNLSGNTREERMVEDLVRKAGVYALYTQLTGWELTLLEKSDSQRTEMLEEWLKSVRSMPSLSTHFYLQLRSLLEIKDDAGLRSIFSNYNSKLKEILKLKKALQKKYPEETNSLQNVFENIRVLDLEHKKIKIELEYAKSYDEYKRRVASKHKERLESKHRKQSEIQNLKPNQCPRCNFDGSTVVRTGPLKGMKFPKGFKIQHREGEIAYWYCPQCTYSETRPISQIV